MPSFLRWALIIGLMLAAYVVGAKAGRSRYREISHAARRLWDDPGVKRVRQKTYRKIEKAATRAAKKIGA